MLNTMWKKGSNCCRLHIISLVPSLYSQLKQIVPARRKLTMMWPWPVHCKMTLGTVIVKWHYEECHCSGGGALGMAELHGPYFT